MQHRDDIDGLRAIAVLAVIGFHAFPALVPGGFVGVDVFFVISGYLISQLLRRAQCRDGIDLKHFYARRIRRIFPALIVVLAMVLAFATLALYPDEARALARHAMASIGFVANLQLWSESGYFSPRAALDPLLHLWSLGIEEQFYLLWPLLLLLVGRASARVLILMACVAVLSFGWNLIASERSPLEDFYAPHTRAWEFIVGAALAELEARGWRPSPRAAQWLAGAGIAALAATLWLLDGTTPYPGSAALAPTLAAASLIAAGPGSALSRSLLANRPLVGIGLISYPLYLWHWPLLSFARILSPEPPSAGMCAALMAAAVVLAALTFWLVERPIRFRVRWAAMPAALVLAMAGLFYVSYQSFAAADAASRVPLAAAGGSDEALRHILFDKQARLADDHCRALLGHTPADVYCAVPGDQPRILVVGDSHAIAFTLAPVNAHDPDIAAIAATSCPPLKDFAAVDLLDARAEKSAKCSRLMDTALELTARLPSIRWVVLVSRTPLYASGSGYGPDATVHRMRLVSTATVQEVETRAAMLEGLQHSARAFAALGREVILLGDVPELAIDPRECALERPWPFAQHLHGRCDIARGMVTARERRAQSIEQSALSAMPGVRQFEVAPLLCDAERCSAKYQGQLQYFDHNHLSLAGSERVYGAFRHWLESGEAIARPAPTA